MLRSSFEKPYGIDVTNLGVLSVKIYCSAHEEDDGEVVETDATPTAVQITDYKKDSVTTIGTISPAEDFQVMILDADASKFSQGNKTA